jgi:hypothetical protein
MKSQSVIAKPDPELARWCAALSAPSTLPDIVPKGWFTIAQISDKLGRSSCNTQQRMRVMLKDGRAEQQTFRIATGKQVRPVPHYRLK